MTKGRTAKVLQFRPSRRDLEAEVRLLAAESGKVYFGTHSRDRMVERGITRAEAVKVLRTGFIEGDITSGEKPGEWRCKMVARIKGSREIGVVAITVIGREIFVKTVEWEDI